MSCEYYSMSWEYYIMAWGTIVCLINKYDSMCTMYECSGSTDYCYFIE